MTLQQLRFLREIARQSLNISNAAAVLHTSQPGVSRQIQLLERELGVQLLQRRKNRILGFTEPGREILQSAQRMLNEAENIRLIAEETREQGKGQLMLATSHLHARYTLLGPVKAFTERYPGVELHLLQADPDDIPALVEANEADVGISTELRHKHRALVTLSGGTIRRSLIVPRGHPLSGRKRVALADIARYPIVGYNPRFRGGQIISQTFRDHGVKARFVVSASDSDVIKAYVAEGLGIAIVPTLALDGSDSRLSAVDVTELFPKSTMTVSLRPDFYPRRYLLDFISMLVPKFSRGAMHKALHASSARPSPANATREKK
jgi:LysR family cys regulon transcriptional activator